MAAEPELRVAVANVAAGDGLRPLLVPPGVAAVAYFEFARRDPVAADFFFDRLSLRRGHSTLPRSGVDAR